MNYWRKNIFLFAAVVILDQLTKYWAVKELVVPWVITPFLKFELFYNRGTSWGFFGDGQHLRLITIVVLAVTAMLANYIYNRMKQRKMVYPEILVFGGAVSNIIDRFVHAGVVDFITLHLGSWYWPTFNIADACIVVGVFWMFISQD